METENLLLILLMLVFSAFFSGGEMAFLASNKLVLEINRKRNPRISRIIDIFMAKPGILIATILVGNNIALVVYGLIFNETFDPIFTQHISGSTALLLVQTITSTIIIIVTAEFLPKTLIQSNPTLMLCLLALPLLFFYIIFYPIGYVMQKTAHAIMRKFFGDEQAQDDSVFLPGRVDLDNLLSKQVDTPNDEGDSVITQEAKLMKNALDFSKIKVRDCAIPRTEIVAIDIEDPLEELHQKFIESHYSKILVYQETIDNIIGYVHVSEMFKGSKTVKSMMSPIAIVPETMGANKLLKQFTEQHKSIALVVDEFGGTAGMVTLEDVLEEIFGEINDEHDEVEHYEEKISEKEYILSGRLEIDYINEKYDIELPTSDEYDTLAGLILNVSHSIPEKGEEFEIEGFKFTILEASTSKIEKVKVLCD